MKLKVKYVNSYGREFFYPEDEWTKKFLSIMRSGDVKCLSRRQIDIAKELGFEIESVAEEI